MLMCFSLTRLDDEINPIPGITPCDMPTKRAKHPNFSQKPLKDLFKSMYGMCFPISDFHKPLSRSRKILNTIWVSEPSLVDKSCPCVEIQVQTDGNISHEETALNPAQSYALLFLFPFHTGNAFKNTRR